MAVIDDLHRLQNDPDFVALGRFDFSLEQLLRRYPNGVPARLAAQALMLTEEQADALYEETLAGLRSRLEV